MTLIAVPSHNSKELKMMHKLSHSLSEDKLKKLMHGVSSRKITIRLSFSTSKVSSCLMTIDFIACVLGFDGTFFWGCVIICHDFFLYLNGVKCMTCHRLTLSLHTERILKHHLRKACKDQEMGTYIAINIDCCIQILELNSGVEGIKKGLTKSISLEKN